MKDKILYLILGILIGAVITAGCFLVFSKSQNPGMRGGERPDMSDMSEEDLEKFRGQRPDGNMVPPDAQTTNPAQTSTAENTVTE